MLLHHDLLAGHLSGFDYLVIHPERHKVTNVITMFGVMQSALGAPGALAAAALLGAPYYALLIFTWRTRNAWLAATYSFCATVLCSAGSAISFRCSRTGKCRRFGLMFRVRLA